MNFTIPNFLIAMPEMVLIVLTSIILIGDTIWSKYYKNITYYMTQLTLIIVGGVIAYSIVPEQTFTFNDSFIRDRLADTLKLFILLLSLGVFIFSKEFMLQKKFGRGEYYVLGLFGILGMFVMVSAYNMISLYLGLEIMSLSIYSMIALRRNSTVATEAASKYFVLGALATGILLYGFTMIYGATGQINFDMIANVISSGKADSFVLSFGIIFIVIGMAFKMGAAPFHMWIPDVYHGSPTSVTLYISSIPKIATLAVIYRLLVEAMPELSLDWQQLFVILAVVSLLVGSIIAIAQDNFKRMLAYSGISHVGFIFLGIVSANYDGFAVSIYYVLVYAITSIAGFGIIIVLGKSMKEFDSISDFKGLNDRNPWLALMMLFILFSMAGLPPFVGFFAKLFVIEAVVRAGLTWLAILAVIAATISIFYYLRVVKTIYFDKPDDTSGINAVSRTTHWTVSLVAIGLLILGLLPSELIGVVFDAVNLTK